MNFFVLHSVDFEEADGVIEFHYADKSHKGQAPRCPSCDQYIGMIPTLSPIHVILEMYGDRWGDIAFGPGNQRLMSSRLIDLFQKSGMTGITELLPTIVERTLRRRFPFRGERPDYWLASIAHSRTMLDETASGLVREEGPICKDCRTGGIIKRIDRVIVKRESWAGEDIFRPRGLSGTVLTSERFVQMCKEHELVNCHFTRAEEYGFNFYRE